MEGTFIKRLGAGLLAAAMLAAAAPVTALAATADTGKAIQLVDNGTAANISGGQADSIYFGTYQQSSDGTGGYSKEPAKWQVLSNEEGKLFLFADTILDIKDYNEEADETPDRNIHWSECSLRAWLNDAFVQAAFSENERTAIPQTEITTPVFDVPNGSSQTVNNTGTETTTDQVFLLSVEDAKTDAYFPGDWTSSAFGSGKTSLLASHTTDYVKGITGTENIHYWLRTPGSQYETGKDYESFSHYDSASEILFGYGIVDDRGLAVYLVSQGHTYAGGVRPAFNLDLNSVLFTSAAVGGKSASGMDAGLTAVDDDDGSDWKLTLFDDQREFSISVAEREDNTVDFSYSDATTGQNEYISAVITENGELTHYGRILQLDGTKNGPNGTASITLPAGVTLSDTVKLYVFNEQYNGGENDNTKLTDYASQLQEVTFDTTAPELTAGTATRESETSATVTFTSNEAGTCYYAVVDRGAAAPTIDTTGTGIPCTVGENTLSLTLDAGAKDLYLVVKDAAGNESEMLKVEIPASALAAPQNPVLTGTAPGQAAAAWDAVANASGYAVQLYKDGAPQGEPMKVQGTDCTFAITEAGGYTFTVTALGKDGQYRDSEASGPSGPLPFYEISFAEGGIPAQYVPQGGQAAEPSAPAKEGYTFGGWYTDSALTTAWDFENDRVTRSMTLYAKWATVPAVGGSGTSGTSEAPAATPAPQDDAAYYTCPACGYHNWTATADGYRCDHCGNIVTAQLSGYGNVKGAWDPAAAAASGAAYSGPIPATGDEADPALWAAVCGLSALALLALAAYRRKRL